MDTDVDVPAQVLEAFGAPGAHIEALSGGRTNRTMRVRAGRDLVLQHLRPIDEADLLGIMENLVRVTSHLEWKHALAGGAPEASWWPQLVPTTSGQPFMMTEQGQVWRAYIYREGRIARTVQRADVLESAAGLFGRFTEAAADLGGPDLGETTRHFHDLDAVWLAFESEIDTASADPERRAELERIRPDLDLVRTTARAIEERSGNDGLASAPRRVVHNDTKVSNALLHPSEPRAIAVLDLDLVMMGPAWHDVGDLVRSAAWHTGPEPPAFDAQLTGRLMERYVERARQTLTDEEIATFAIAGPRLAFELGVRYFTDHLRTEPRLRVDSAEGHDGRGRANVKLATEMLNAYDALRSAVDGILARR